MQYRDPWGRYGSKQGMTRRYRAGANSRSGANGFVYTRAGDWVEHPVHAASGCGIATRCRSRSSGATSKLGRLRFYAYSRSGNWFGSLVLWHHEPW